MTDVTLELIDNFLDIQRSLDTFNMSFAENPELGRSLIRTTSFWVYDPISERFGPSKFVGFKNMTMEKYQSARDGYLGGNLFNGHITRKAIESILGAYTENVHLSVELTNWAVSLLGSDALVGIDESKWKFVSL
jgi:hypothetical protein